MLHCKHCGLGESWAKFSRRFEAPSENEAALEKFVSHCQDVLLNQKSDFIQYFISRGFTEETVYNAKLGLCLLDSMYEPSEADFNSHLVKSSGEWHLSNRITIPYIHHGIVTQVRGRVLSDKDKSGPKYLSLLGAKSELYFPFGKVDPKLRTIGNEGELGALLLTQEGLQSIGIPGATAAPKDKLREFTDLYICYDPDEAGVKGANSLIKSIPEVRRIDLPEGYDADEYVKAFGIDSFKKLVDKAVLYINGLPQKEDKLSVVVSEFVDWSWTNHGLIGTKIDWSPRLEKTFSGWRPGLFLLGAREGSGKSHLLVHSILSTALDNPNDAIAVYLSFDDGNKNTLSRFLANHCMIDINDIQAPRSRIEKDPELLKQYNEGVDSFKEINNLIVRDTEYGRGLRSLRYFLGSLRNKYPNHKIVVALDSLSKVIPESHDEDEEVDASGRQNVKAFLAGELKYLSVKYQLCIITPTDLRKPTGFSLCNADLSGAAELAYEADVIMLCEKDPSITWHDSEADQSEPVFMMNVSKNKLTGKEGWHYFKLLTRQSTLEEVSNEEHYAYNQMRLSGNAT